MDAETDKGLGAGADKALLMDADAALVAGTDAASGAGLNGKAGTADDGMDWERFLEEIGWPAWQAAMEASPEEMVNWRRRRLQPSAELAKILYGFGLAGVTRQDSAMRLGVDRTTLYHLLKESLPMRRAYERGGQRRESLRNAVFLERNAIEQTERRARAHADAGRGEPWEAVQAGELQRRAGPSGCACPTCGRDTAPGAQQETITFTLAEFKDARKKFEDLIARHLAARKTPRASKKAKRHGVPARAARVARRRPHAAADNKA